MLLDSNAIRIADRPPTFLPTPEEFVALMGRLGITNRTRVIAYDDRGGIYATRLWWILNYYGSWEEWGNRDDTPIVRPK